MSNKANAGNAFLRWWLALVVLAGVVLVSGRAMAQAVTATVVGTITDTTGAVVPNVPVTLTNQDTGVVTNGKANGSGNYEFTFLQPGTYTVGASQSGFKNIAKKDIAVPVNTTTRVDLTFEPGASSETVEVTGQPALLQTDRADVSAQIDERQVEDLPVGNERNFQSLESLVPGVSRPIYDHSSFFDAQNSQSFTVNGQSEESNNLQFEGIDDNERTGLLQVYIPPAAAIKTVDVETSNYAPEFGRSAGAVTNVVMKSGSNQFHGSAYEFNQISALQSRGYFNRTGAMPRVVNNYYGATLGGPIRKDKTFFFGDFLRYSNHAGQFNLLTVPTAAFRSGDLSASTTTIYDPNTGTVNPTTGVVTGRTAFTNNQIPTNRISPLATKILALVPLPNVPGAGLTQNYQANTSLNVDTNTYDVKVDQKLRTADVLTGRYSWQRTKTVQSPVFGKAGGPTGGGFEGTGINTVFNTALEYTHIFTPTLFTELRGGVDHYRNVAQSSDYGTTASTDLGIPGVNLDAATSGLVGIDLGAYSSPMVGYSASLPWVRAETNIDLVNNWTKILGNHSIKAGWEIRRVRDDLTQGQTFSQRGVFRYREGQTSTSGAKTSIGNDFASFLLDVPSQVGRDLNVRSGSWRQTLYFGFIQDTWVATQKLTLTYGVRYELYPPPTPAYKGGYSQYFPADNTLHVSGYGNVPNDIGMRWNPLDFEPRIGLAYRASPTTVVRAGFGVSRTPFQDNTYAFNYPVRQNVAFNSIGSYTPALLPNGNAATLGQGFPAVAPAAIPDTGILQAPGNSNYIVINTDYRDPEVTSYNLTLQQQFANDWVFDIGYVGNEGRYIPSVYNLNAGQIPGQGANGQPYYILRKQSGSIDFRSKNTTSNYNSLQSRLTHRFSHFFELTSSFTWQKAMGFVSTGGGLAGPNFYIDPHRDYAPLSFNRTVTVANSVVFTTPFGSKGKYLTHGAAGFILGGWQLSAVNHLETGTPLFITDSGNTLNTPGTTQVPDLIAPFKALKSINGYWFDPNSFATHVVPGPGVVAPNSAWLGNVGKNSFTGPGQVTFDAAAARTFRLFEGVDLQFRADAFNALNHPNFDNPQQSRTNTNFGRVTGGGGGRSVQLAATLKF